MDRYNIFPLIHKALRAMLYDAALSIQQTDFSNAREARTVTEKIRELHFIFRKHASHEDHFIVQRIAGFERSIVNGIRKENKEVISSAAYLLKVVNMYSGTVTRQDRVMAGSALSRAFRDYMIISLNQMAREESLITPVLWRHYSDAEIRNMYQKMQDSYSAMENEVISLWMLRGLNKGEVTGWLEDLYLNAPYSVFRSIMELAEQELPDVFRDEVLETLAREEAVS